MSVEAVIDRDMEELSAKVVRALEVCGTYSPADVWKALDADEMQAWGDKDNLVISRIELYPQMKLCEVFIVAGDMDACWEIVSERVEPWAKRLGCSKMVGRGKLPWARVVKKFGYEPAWVSCVKDLTDV